MKFLFKHSLAKFCLVYFFLILAWWVKIFLSQNDVGTENYAFNFSYIIFNILGGFAGIFIAGKKWGGLRSAIGRGLTFLGLGLLSQGFGLVIWTYYNLILRVEIPYPSLADIGYFGLIPLYAIAMFNFAHASGSKLGLKSISGKLKVIAIPTLVLLGCYVLFIQNVGFDPAEPLKSLLDVAYPAGEAISVSLGLLTLTLSQGVLGGKMKKRVTAIIVALVFQFITEFTFLFTSGKGIYFNASFVDLMYATSYFLMTLSLITFTQIEDD